MAFCFFGMYVCLFHPVSIMCHAILLVLLCCFRVSPTVPGSVRHALLLRFFRNVFIVDQVPRPAEGIMVHAYNVARESVQYPFM